MGHRSADSIEACGHRIATEAGYMTASDHRAFSKSLAGRGPSIHDGRDLLNQAKDATEEVIGQVKNAAR
jgi:hypothetical protein